ncbi:hypothetical protein K8R33_00595 [archaeon]|nr:hypothetical protein [archaeon]
MIKKLFKEVKKSFPELKIKMLPGRANSFMVSRPFGDKIYYNKKKFGQYKFSDTAIKGIIAHELAHKTQAKKANIFEKTKILLNQKFSIFNNLKEEMKIEREADKIVIKRGYGKELIQFYKEIEIKVKDKKFIQKKKKSHLSIKEIKKLMK